MVDIVLLNLLPHFPLSCFHVLLYLLISVFLVHLSDRLHLVVILVLAFLARSAKTIIVF